LLGLAKPNEFLRKAREDHGWTQAELAEKVGSTSVNVSRWENGITFPGPYFRTKLCELYGKKRWELGLVREGNEEDVPESTRPVFLFNEPLPGSEELYGRKRERETLISRTARKASTSITGPRRIGKTWLIQYLCQVMAERLGPRFRMGYLDGMSPQCKTVTGFAAEALSKLSLPVPAENEGLVSLDKGLQQLMAKKIVSVLCIDEFDRFGANPGFSLDFFGGLRAMCSTSDLVLVIASKNPLHLVVNKDAQGSPFFNIFERILLKPFTYSETEQFIREKGIAAKLSPQDRDYLWNYGRVSATEQSWLPLRLQLAGKLLCEEAEQVRREPAFKQSFEEQFNALYEPVSG
jgi:transcriptional regulator with XRE-family HTH domain